MPYVTEVERIDHESGIEAGFVRWIRVALAVYLIPALLVVLVFGALTIVVSGLISILLCAARFLPIPREMMGSSRENLQGLIPGERIKTRNGSRCGRYMQVLGGAGELSWSPSSTTSLH